MRIITFLLLLILILPFSVMAEQAGLRPSVERLSHCVQQQGDACRGLLTTESLPLYERTVADGLMPCLPADATYVAQAPLGNAILVRVTTQASGTPRIMRLYFTQENSVWKLNLPATLEAGMGAEWQQRLNMAEQVYLLLRQQAGGTLSCSVLQGLVQQKQ